MPNGEIPISNPPPLPSHLPDSVLELAVRPQQKPLPDNVRQSLRGFQRAAEYIAAGKLGFAYI
jgi:xylulose-5-phosphate/fructose-6-phosphate phosphoketolase